MWLGAGFVLKAFFGLSWLGCALLVVFGALAAAQAQLFLSHAIARKALDSTPHRGRWSARMRNGGTLVLKP